MTKESRPASEGDGSPVDELAATELSGARTRTGPRVAGQTLQARTVGRFRLDAQLGSGGMGEVFRAYDPVLDRAVALKVLRSEATSDDAQRLRRVVREARAAAALTHPNTVTIFEVGEADNEVFIAMELLEGEDLRAVIERGEASLDDKLRWLREAARALAAAHERGLVHRDVKPENMFVCRDGTLKLLDFGIAKRDDDDAVATTAADIIGPSSLRTQEGRRVGTPRYMAPEQRAGNATDLRTDEYAWGLVAFELLTGSDVIATMATITREGGADVDAAAEDFTAQRAEALRASLPDLPEAIIITIARALEPRKEDRFPSMAPIVDALDRKPDAATARHPPEERAEPAALPKPVRTERTPPTRLARGWIVGAVGLIALGAIAGKTVHRSAVLPSACRVESTEALTVEPDDRVVVMPDGTVIIARDIRKGITLERVTPSGRVPILRDPRVAALAGTYDDLDIGGFSVGGVPTISLQLYQDGPGGALFVTLTEKNGMGIQRIWGPLTGAVSTHWGNDILVVATSPDSPRTQGYVSGAEIWLLGNSVKGAARPILIEEGEANDPAIAANDDAIAVAYRSMGAIHLALLDETLQRTADVMTTSATEARPAVAFADRTATVFWADGKAGRTRLTMSSFTPGDKAMTPPRELSDESVLGKRPVTAQLPGGAWAVAWVSATAPLTLRVSPIGKGGALTGPTDVAKGPRIDGLRVTSTPRGVAYAWFESATIARIAHVVCTPPRAGLGGER